MALSSEAHVIVFVVNDSRRPARFCSDQSRYRRGNGRLRLLPTKPTSHPFTNSDHMIEGHPQHLGNDLLNLSRMLRRRVDRHLSKLAWHSNRNMRLQIKMFLPSDMQNSFQ